MDTTCPAMDELVSPSACTFEVTDDCVHPEVEEDCADGWCEIPPGCFVYGSPMDEPCHAPNLEPQVQVTLPRGFRMKQTGHQTPMSFNVRLYFYGFRPVQTLFDTQ